MSHHVVELKRSGLEDNVVASAQLAHHSVTGCNMRPGDLLASGTISGPVCKTKHRPYLYKFLNVCAG